MSPAEIVQDVMKQTMELTANVESLSAEEAARLATDLIGENEEQLQTGRDGLEVWEDDDAVVRNELRAEQRQRLLTLTKGQDE